MSVSTLPRIRLGALEVSRLIVGGNPISGFSHAGPERTQAMLEYFTVARIKQLFAACEAQGVDTVIARVDAFILRVLAEYWREGGRIRWIAQTAPEHRDPYQNIRLARNAGASAIYVHGGDAGTLFETGKAEEVRARVECIRSLGLPAGMAAHDPAYHLEAQRLGFPLDFHMVCMYNLTGYLGRRDAEPKEEFAFADRAIALEALRKLERPCIAYKIYGAGRLTPEQAYADVGRALRPGDGVLVGMFPPDRPDIVGDNVRRVAALSTEFAGAGAAG
jgi:hypothetical protein